eukprot:CAMPEP_0174707268 /NCGR_PEP_ID=MMETSP1094-20130205/9829_1 /TAXON_ID=156173 /ORGANISM="Chrysochromulina brevifilum, Strain UTEX LB 985" /LENGTH=43 /DNA_ID= /DNA_START= /DNA_END= /DNA_ORIENTATION=
MDETGAVTFGWFRMAAEAAAPEVSMAEAAAAAAEVAAAAVKAA